MKGKVLLLTALLLAVISHPTEAGLLETYEWYEDTQTATVKQHLTGKEYVNITLIENTEQCLVDCEQILNYKFINNVNGKKNSDYKIKYYKNGNREINIFSEDSIYLTNITTNYTKNTYEIRTHSNGTKYYKENGTTTYSITEESWSPFEFNKNFKADENYIVKTVVSKKVNDNIDWKPNFMGEEINEMAWWNSTWLKKKAIIVNASNSVSMYQLFFNVTYDSDMQADFDDIRFTDSADSAELNYYKYQSVAGSWATFYVNMSLVAGNTTQLYMYYNNTEANTTSSGQNTFYFFDDFNDGDYTNNPTWTVVSGAFSATNNYLQGTTVDTWAAIVPPQLAYNTATIPLTHEFNATWKNGADGNAIWTILGYTNAGIWDGLQFRASTVNGYQIVKNVTNTNIGDIDESGTWKELTVKYDTNGTVTMLNFTNPIGTYNDADPISNSDWYKYKSYEVGDAIDNIRVSYYLNDNPEVFFGREQLTDGSVQNAPVEGAVLDTASVLFNCTATATGGLTNNSVFVWHSNNTLFKVNYTEVTGTENISTWNISNFPDGGFNWACQTNNNDTYWSSNRTLTIDLGPPTIDIVFPNKTWYNDTERQSLLLNYTATDGQGVDACWFNINGTNITISSCANSTINASATYSTNLTLWANDTAGNLNSATFSFNSWNLLSETYASQKTETDSATFKIVLGLNTTAALAVSPLGNLTWNVSTNYAGTRSNTSDNITFTKTINIPAVSSDINATWHWEIELDSLKWNTSNRNLTVNNLLIDDCSSGADTEIIFNLFDEQTRTSLKGDSYGIFTVWNTSESLAQTYNITYSNNNQFKFCASPTGVILNANIDLYYSESNTSNPHESRVYYLRDTVLSGNATNISIYLINTSLSTTFELFVRDEGFTPKQNVIVSTQRYFPSINAYEVVDMGITDTLGKTLTHLIVEDEFYRYIITEDGSIIFSSEPGRAYCSAAPCTIIFTLTTGIGDFFEHFEPQPNIIWNISYNNATETMRLEFADTSGLAQQFRLEVNQIGTASDTLICNSTSTSSSGLISCDLTNQTGVFYSEAYVSSPSEVILGTFYEYKTSDKQIFGNEGVFWSLILLVTLMLLGTWNPSVAILFGIVGMVITMSLGLMTVSFSILVATIIMGMVLIWRLRT